MGASSRPGCFTLTELPNSVPRKAAEDSPGLPAPEPSWEAQKQHQLPGFSRPSPSHYGHLESEPQMGDLLSVLLPLSIILNFKYTNLFKNSKIN